MPDDLGLVFNSVVGERFAGFQSERVAAERMPHQRQIEKAAFLRLPDVGQSMHGVKNAKIALFCGSGALCADVCFRPPFAT